MKILKHIFIFQLFSLSCFAQVVQQWITTPYYPPGGISAVDMCLDQASNCYVSISAFDTVYLNGAFLTVKLNTSGNVIWSQVYDSINLDEIPHVISSDTNGNVYVTGEFYDQMVAQTGGTIKYNSAGVFQWARTYGYDGRDNEVDMNGNLCALYYDQAVVIIKYDGAGNILWTRRNDTAVSNNVITPYFIKIDKNNNIYVGGTHSIGAINSEYFLKKFNSSGVFKWDRRYDPTVGVDDVSGMVIDDSANIYLTGTTALNNTNNNHFATVKYDSAGNQRWNAVFSTISDTRPSVAGDKNGNAYVAGYSNNGTTKDYAIIKYGAAGNQIWIDRYDSAITGGAYVAITNDKNQNVYFSCLNQLGKCATIKLDTAGNILWDMRTLNNARPSRVLSDTMNNIFVSVTNNGGSVSVIKYNQTTGIEENQNDYSVQFYPNPFPTTAHLKINPEIKNGELQIFDLLGNEIKNQKILTNPVEIYRDNLPAGIYFYRVVLSGAENKIIANGKMIIN